mgnify:CR=1 FL=1
MNIKNIQKNYNLLSADERFALLVAADDRGDETDRAALLSSAPRKTWQVPTTRGLGEAFNDVSMAHVIYLLGCISTFYYLALLEDPDPSPKHAEALEVLPLQILTGCEAWRGACKHYGVNSEKFLEGLPFLEMIKLTELTLYAGYEDPPELPKLEETTNGLIAAIEESRKKWE